MKTEIKNFLDDVLDDNSIRIIYVRDVREDTNRYVKYFEIGSKYLGMKPTTKKEYEREIKEYERKKTI